MKNNKILLIAGIILLIAGYAKSGLWPWQLPAVIIGSLMTIYAFKKMKNI